jgi:hypothetical protein
MCCKKHDQDNNTQSFNERSQFTSIHQVKKETESRFNEAISNFTDDDSSNTDASEGKSETISEDVIETELQAILARLVSDYRAIFAIEDEIHHGGPHCLTPHCHSCHSYQEGHNIRYATQIYFLENNIWI